MLSKAIAMTRIPWGIITKKVNINKIPAIKSKMLPISGKKGIAFISKITENKIITPLGKSIPVMTDNKRKATNRSNKPNILTIKSPLY